MTIQDIKLEIGISTLDLHKSHDGNGNETDWLRHWDNTTRTAVSIHKDTAYELKSNPTISNLGLQKDIKNGEQGQYTAYRIVRYKSEPLLSI